MRIIRITVRIAVYSHFSLLAVELQDNGDNHLATFRGTLTPDRHGPRNRSWKEALCT